ncbi:GrdX family protein [Acetohalobium arabaticum]|uniref:GrdX protein n=1 Tax=Acetohalobium arabaticum (strain ATCC 49924 / DSM 5501 / Z-7288) TaxID=574087 RepID=D9QPZ2_ACEAZ|nr:GrdX family protein [Acetohalobium arabaticum]ADL12583.1 GrdX protein [Acetohalobium arabaticum DSM 5501]
MKYFILSNNPIVRENFEQVYFVKVSVKELLIKVRNLVHKGHELITHPLPASMKIMSSPFRSIVLSKDKQQRVDAFQVEVIEESIFKLRYHIQQQSIDNDNDDDYQMLDYRLLRSALESSNKIAL